MTPSEVRAQERENRFLLIGHKYKSVAQFVGSRSDWWAECDLFGCARDREALVRSIEQQYAERRKTPQPRRRSARSERVFAQIYGEFRGSARLYVSSLHDLGADYALFKSVPDPKALAAKIQPQYNKWRAKLPKNRGTVVVVDGRVLFDDGNLAPGQRSRSVRTVSGGLPTLGNRR